MSYGQRPKLFWTWASYGVRCQVHVSAAFTADDRYNCIFLYTYHSWSSFRPIRRNVASIVEMALPSSLMRLGRLQWRSEIGSERKILYLCWKSNSENPLGIAGLHPLNPYHVHGYLPREFHKHYGPSVWVTWFKLLRKQTNAGTSTALFSESH